jgi:hypothetical protein
MADPSPVPGPVSQVQRYTLVDLVDRFERWDRSLDADAEYVKWSDVAAALQQAQATIPHLQALVEKWRERAAKMRANARDTVVESLIAQRADAFIECENDLAAALLSAIPAPREPQEEETNAKSD